MYENGFNCRNIATQSLSAIIIEMIIRLYFSIQSVQTYMNNVEIAEDYSNFEAIKQFKKDNINTIMLTGDQEKVAQENLEAAKAFKAQIDPCSVTIPIKAGENGKVFGSVAAQNIADAAKTQLGFELDKKKIQLSAPIRETGEKMVDIKLHPQVTASLKVVVTAE